MVVYENSVYGSIIQVQINYSYTCMTYMINPSERFNAKPVK